MSENKRLVWSEVAPQGAKALYGIHLYITTRTDLPHELIHLIFLRVAQMSLPPMLDRPAGRFQG
jgi:hypothetical protein